MRSRRTAQFIAMLRKLPWQIQETARRKYDLFRSNPNHPSFQVKRVRATEHWPLPHWEYRINRSYRATCFRDDDAFVWVFIGDHDEFEEFYR